jgi:hypothetical protein
MRVLWIAALWGSDARRLSNPPDANPVDLAEAVSRSSLLHCPVGKFVEVLPEVCKRQKLDFPCCAGCPMGKFYWSGQVDSVITSREQRRCHNCQNGRFQNQTGQPSCLECPAGKISEVLSWGCVQSCQFGSQQLERACVACHAGQYSFINQSISVCRSCQPGRYQPMALQASCNRCAIGQFQPKQHQKGCSNCEPGR